MPQPLGHVQERSLQDSPGTGMWVPSLAEGGGWAPSGTPENPSTSTPCPDGESAGLA